MKDWMIAQGWLAIATGVVLIPLLPFSMAGAVSFGFGLYLVMDAYLIYYAGRYDADETHLGSKPLMIEGLLALLIGLYAIVRPLMPVLSTAWTIGIWYLIAGAFTLFSARTDRYRLRRPGAYLASGVFSLVAGIFLIAMPVGGSALQLGVAFYLLVYGTLLLAASSGLRRETEREATISPR